MVSLRLSTASRLAALVIVVLASGVGASSAQIVLNPGLYPTNTALNDGRRAEGTLEGIAPHEGVTIDFAYGLDGSAVWNGGVRFVNASGVEQLWTQNRTTGFEADTGRLTMRFSTPVRRLTLAHGGLDYDDTVQIDAFRDGRKVSLAASDVADRTGGVIFDETAPGTLRLRGPGAARDDFRQTQYRLVLSDGAVVDELRFRVAKRSASSSNVTLAFFEFGWEADPVAREDEGEGLPGSVAIADLRVNDSVSGERATPANSTVLIAPGSKLPRELAFDPATGEVGITAGADPGLYAFEYQLCEAANSDWCSVAAVSVTVRAAPAQLEAAKTVAMADGEAGFALPGEDVVYAITVRNVGGGPVDADSIFLVDTIPTDVTFRNLPLGPKGAVGFESTGAGVTFGEDDATYSDAVASPKAAADCDYTPTPGYDPAVRHLCLAPKGTMRAGEGGRQSAFTVRFRARID